MIHAGTASAWTNTKQALAFCHVTQDGDDEVCLHLDRLPNQGEAAELRHRVRKRLM